MDVVEDMVEVVGVIEGVVELMVLVEVMGVTEWVVDTCVQL